jgi:calpain-15
VIIRINNCRRLHLEVLVEAMACVCPGCTLLKPQNPEEASFGFKTFLCCINVFLTPFLLIFHSIEKYCVPCIAVTLGKFGNFIITCGYNASCMSCCMYKDKAFPPTEKSLGSIEAGCSGVVWKRIPELANKDQQPVIFDKTIAASDVCQGVLGDCWLLAAFAVLCEKKSLVQNCFITQTYNPYGKYRIRLFDAKTRKFVAITIDDYIPCSSSTGKPIFTKFNGNEMWPLLLEKAYAKFKGSYAEIEGGWPVEAMRDLTGFEGGTFQSPLTDAIFDKLHELKKKGCLMAAGSKGKDNTRVEGREVKMKHNIIGGHAYSILDIKTPHFTTSNIRLLKMRNPWYVI